MQKKAPIKTEASILFLRSLKNSAETAAGAVKSARTRIIPTTRISTTTVIAISARRKYSRNVVFIPIIEANSWSKRYKAEGLYKSWDDIPENLIVKTGNYQGKYQYGPKAYAALSDAELLAILIGNGTRELSAVDLSKEILRLANNDLHSLSKLSITDFQKIKGIGEAKAITIMAALELGRRRKENAKQERLFLNSSKSAYEHFKPYLTDLKHEEFWILCLSRRLEIQKTIQISTGGIAGTVVDPKIIFKHALDNLSNAILLCHNHPSGNLNPSSQDLHLTKRLVEAGKLLDISVADHIIFTDDSYYSFADNGQI